MLVSQLLYETRIAGSLLEQARYQSHVAQPRQLDRAPLPQKVVQPAYGARLAEQGIRGDVKVSFYIDPQGQVRMPAPVEADHPELAYLATEALRQWVFQPPTRAGRPVLVQAVQRFSFSPSTGAKP